MRSAIWPLIVIWLALHAALLAIILGMKFVGLKLAVMLSLLLGMAWFFMRQPRRLALSRRRVV